MPHTINAQPATVCGIDPPARQKTDSLGGRIPARCLPDLLNDQGYETAYVQSATEDFERRPEVVKNMGYEEFYPTESMDTEGFQVTNTFGYEDDIMRTSRRTISSTATSIAYTTWTPSCRT